MGSYLIAEDGYLPAVLKTTTEGKTLFVINKALLFDIENKKIVWEVKELVFNPLANKYTPSVSGRFVENYNTSTITVDNTDFVDSTTGLPCEQTDPNAVGEFDYYVETLGKLFIYPSLQATVANKIQ